MTSSQPNPGEGDARFEEAAGWYLRLRGDLTSEELLEWEQWYALPLNQEALDLVRHVSPIHGRLHRPALLSAERVHADAYDGSVSVAEWIARSTDAVPPSRRWPRYLPSVVMTALAAGIAVIALLGTLFVFGRWHPSSAEPIRIYQTRSGEHQTVGLSDGSTITLGARTRISTHYNTDRRIILLEDGEALFSVAKDVLRPFTVVAAGGTVTAVGTQFNVRSDLNRVTVTVSEGAVDVQPAGIPTLLDNSSEPAGAERAPVWKPARVVKGQEVTYEQKHGRSSVAVADPGATEWTSGRLQYRRVPLKFVVADVQRYFNKTIVLGDTAAGEYEFTGTIHQSEVTDWFPALEKIFPLEVQQSEEHVLIRSRPDTIR